MKEILTPNIEVPHMLGLLIKQCETKCAAECCGISAFNFSPLNIAFFFTVNELKPECVTKEDVARVKREVKRLKSNSVNHTSVSGTDFGFLKPLRSSVNKQEFAAMCEEIEHNIDIARELVLEMQKKRYKNDQK